MLRLRLNGILYARSKFSVTTACHAADLGTLDEIMTGRQSVSASGPVLRVQSEHAVTQKSRHTEEHASAPIQSRYTIVDQADPYMHAAGLETGLDKNELSI
jgi:hypothetical protein